MQAPPNRDMKTITSTGLHPHISYRNKPATVRQATFVRQRSRCLPMASSGAPAGTGELSSTLGHCSSAQGCRKHQRLFCSNAGSIPLPDSQVLLHCWHPGITASETNASALPDRLFPCSGSWAVNMSNQRHCIFEETDCQLAWWKMTELSSLVRWSCWVILDPGGAFAPDLYSSLCSIMALEMFSVHSLSGCIGGVSADRQIYIQRPVGFVFFFCH